MTQDPKSLKTSEFQIITKIKSADKISSHTLQSCVRLQRCTSYALLAAEQQCYRLRYLSDGNVDDAEAAEYAFHSLLTPIHLIV